MEQAEPRKPGRFKRCPIEKLCFQHGNLRCAHFAAPRAKVRFQIPASRERLLFGLPGAGDRDQSLLQNGQSLLERFQIGGQRR